MNNLQGLSQLRHKFFAYKNVLFILIAVIWTAILTASFFLISMTHRNQIVDWAKSAAKNYYDSQVILKKLNSKLEGLYIPYHDSLSERFATNKIIFTKSGKKLAELNPAYATHLLSEISKVNLGIKGHFVNLNSTNPNYSPDHWERIALMNMNKSDEEIIEIQKIEGKDYLRFARGLIVDNSCLNCHDYTPSKVGSIAGAVSVSLPMEKYWNLFDEGTKGLIIWHVAIWLIGIGCLFIMSILLDKQKSHFIHLEQSFSEIEKRYNALFNRSFDCLFINDLEGNFVDANPAALNLMGYEYGQIKTIKYQDLVEPDELARIFDVHRMIIENGSMREPMEFKLRRSDGKTVFIESMSTLITKDGKPESILGIARDITQKKLNQQSLEASEKRFAALLSVIPIHILVVQNRKYVYANEHAQKALGYSIDEFQGMDAMQIIDQDFHRITLERIENFERGNKNSPIELNFMTKTGEKLLVESSSIPFVYDGVPSAFVMAIDINFKKMVLDELFKSEERYRTLVDNLPGTAYRCKPYYPWDMIFVSKEFEKIVGRAADEVVKNGYSDLIHPDDLDYVEKSIKAAIETKNRFEIEYRILNTDGSLHWVFEKGKAVYNEANIAEYVDGVIVDITDRVKAENALKLSEQKLRSYVENAPEGLIVSDINGKFIDVNPAACQLLGYSSQELSNMEIGQIICHENNNQGNSFPFDRDAHLNNRNYCLKHKDGKTLIVNVSSVTLPDKSILGIYRDVTEKVKIREKLSNISKLNSIGVLAGGIAHNFKNILASMQMSLEFAKMNPTDNNKYLDRLQTAIEQATSLATRFQSFSSGGAPAREIVSLRRLLEEAEQMATSGYNVACDIRISDDLWYAEVDPKQMNEVFMNLIINAREAMNNGGKIYVTAENINDKQAVKLGLRQQCYIKVQFKDEGPGISQDIIKNIFDPFFTTKTKGHGLGLASVHFIIHKHGGMINVESNNGQGASFEIYLPATQSKPQDNNKEINSSGRSKGGKILFMDDDEMIRENITEFGDLLNYHIDTAAEGDEAIRKYSEAIKDGQPYNLVILDLTIKQGKGGEEVIKELKQIDNSVKAVVFSGHSDKPIVANYKDYGFSGKLDKPVRINELNKLLEELL